MAFGFILLFPQFLLPIFLGLLPPPPRHSVVFNTVVAIIGTVIAAAAAFAASFAVALDDLGYRSLAHVLRHFDAQDQAQAGQPLDAAGLDAQLPLLQPLEEAGMRSLPGIALQLLVAEVLNVGTGGLLREDGAKGLQSVQMTDGLKVNFFGQDSFQENDYRPPRRSPPCRRGPAGASVARPAERPASTRACSAAGGQQEVFATLPSARQPWPGQRPVEKEFLKNNNLSLKFIIYHSTPAS
jgi:hypothetical protein